MGGWQIDVASETGWFAVEVIASGAERLVRCSKRFGDDSGALPLYAIWTNGAQICVVRDLRRRVSVYEFGAGLTTAPGGMVQLSDGLHVRRVQAAVLASDNNGAVYWQTAIARVRLNGDGWAEVSFDRGAPLAALLVEGYESEIG